MHGWPALVWLVVLLHGSALAHAQQGKPLDEAARPLFEVGREAYEAGRYADAAEAFERVFALTRHPYMLWNLGNTYEKLGVRDRAAAALRRYLVLMPDASNQVEIQARIDELDRGARAPDTRSPPLRPVPPPLRAEKAVSNTGLLANRTYTWIALGGSIVLGAVSTGLWLDARGQYDALALSCGTRGDCSDARVQSVSTRVTATNLTLGLSVAALAGAVALWFIEAPAPDGQQERLRVDASISPSGGAVLVQGRL